MGKRIISFILVFSIVLSLIVVPSMAADNTWSVVPYVDPSILNGLSNNNLKSKYVYENGVELAAWGNWVWSICTIQLDHIMHVNLYADGDKLGYMTGFPYSVSGSYKSNHVISLYNTSTGESGYYWANTNYYGDVNGDFRVWGNSDIFSRSGTISNASSISLTVFPNQTDSISALIDSFSSSPDPEPDYVYVSACYNDMPLVLSHQGLYNAGSVSFNASYDLFDGAYTPLWDDSLPTNVIAPDLRVSLGPASASSQYIVYKGYPFSSADYSSLSVTGSYSFWAEMAVDYEDLLRPSETFRLYPSFVCLAVNGEPYGSFVSGSNGVFSFDSVVDLSKVGDVYSIGIWAFFSDSVSAVWTQNNSGGFFASDDLEIVGSSVSVVYPEPTPRPSDPTEIVYYQPITPEDTTTDLLPNIPDDIMDDDGSKDRSVWDLIRALVKASWSLTTGIVGNAFDGVSGIVAGVSSIGNFFTYMSPDSSDGAFGIVNYDGDDIWG